MRCLLLTPLLLAAVPAHAYIGPGVGAGTIAVVLGVLASILMAFFAVLWYPIKRVVKKRRSSRRRTEEKHPETPERTSET